VLLLTILDCGNGSFAINSSNGSSISSSSANSNSSTPSLAADIRVSPLSPSMAVAGTMQFTATTEGCRQRGISVGKQRTERGND